MKRDILVVYDYGSGGVWCVVCAESPSAIVNKFPMLHPVEQKPDWLTDEFYEQIRQNRYFDIDAKSTGWLKLMLEEYSRRAY